MPEPIPPDLPEGHSEGSRVGGSVELSEQSTFVGRDQYLGLNVDELVAAMKKAFPGDQGPALLGRLLDDFRLYHGKLHEWKQLHNYLNKIIDAFDQYAAAVDNSYIARKPRNPSDYQRTWWPVKWKVNEMKGWAETIQHIGQPYRVLYDFQLQGEAWVIDLKAKDDDLSQHLQRGLVFERRFSGAVLQRLFQPDPAQEWLQDLFNLTREFEGLVKQHMSQADDHLHEAASELYNLSRQALRN